MQTWMFSKTDLHVYKIRYFLKNNNKLAKTMLQLSNLCSMNVCK